LADRLLLNARVLTLDPRRPEAEALATAGSRILAVGDLGELRPLIGPDTEVVDGEGGLAVPAFHDAHLHLLSYARAASRVDCREVRTIARLRKLLAERAQTQPAGTWIRAVGYDDHHLADGRHPDRHDLDTATPLHPARVQHRGLHLDVLNTRALRLAGLWDATGAAVERDPTTGEPTGRLYHAGTLLRGRLPRQSHAEVAADVRRASGQLLAWGVTSVQDASVTNGPSEWRLFQDLAESGDLRVRTFVMPGAAYQRELPRSVPADSLVRLGPVKIMLNESDPRLDEARALVREARLAGRAVAIHAVSEAEVTLALDLLQSARRTSGTGPDRIEHGAVIPDYTVAELRAAGVTVVGQPSLIYERGDVYRAEFPPELYGWLHRAGSLLAAGVPYAVGSDAPVTAPCPQFALFAACQRTTRQGASLGPTEALSVKQALAAVTLGPARAVGASAELGQLRPGALADVTVLDPDALTFTDAPNNRLVRLTMRAGEVVWRC
jgi:predicted amidohydrolase YtcJ